MTRAPGNTATAKAVPYPETSIPISIWRGIHCSPSSLRFVEEFNGILFRYLATPLGLGIRVCELNAERAGRIVNGERLRG